MTDKVFRSGAQGETFVVELLGSTRNFRYSEIHREANAVRRKLQAARLPGLIIDLNQVDFIDSVMVGTMIQMARETTNRGGKALFCNASDDVRDVLKVMKLGTVWPYYETRAAADDAINAGGS